MRNRLFIVCLTALAFTACRSNSPTGEKDTLSRQAGRVAYKAAQGVGKVAASAGKEIKKDAIELKKGWQDAQKDDKVKKPNRQR